VIAGRAARPTRERLAVGGFGYGTRAAKGTFGLRDHGLTGALRHEFPFLVAGSLNNQCVRRWNLHPTDGSKEVTPARCCPAPHGLVGNPRTIRRITAFRPALSSHSVCSATFIDTPSRASSEPMSRTVWLWLLVIFVGIQFGAGLYEKLAIVPLWADVSADQVLSAMESSGMKRAGRAFWPFVSPVVALVAVINLVVAWRSNATYRRWWLAAAAAMAVCALASYGSFVPQMLAFQSARVGWTAPEIETFVTWWTGLNYLSMTIGGIGWLCALRFLSLSGTGRSTNTAVAVDLMKAESTCVQVQHGQAAPEASSESAPIAGDDRKRLWPICEHMCSSRAARTAPQRVHLTN
jgi:hypothetical protein